VMVLREMFTMILLVCGSRWGVDKGSPPSLDAFGALPDRYLGSASTG
jgi:hypothetical protein